MAASSAPATAAVSSASRTLSATLAEQRLEVTVPAGWSIDHDESNEDEGVISLGPEGGEARGGSWNESAFLDGSLVTRVPASAAEGSALALARDECKHVSDCTVLTSEARSGSVLVTFRTPVSLIVEVWIATPPDRAVRCVYEAWARPHRRSVLDDAAALAAVRSVGEAYCRSVRRR
jgi:hypothetical protein